MLSGVMNKAWPAVTVLVRLPAFAVTVPSRTLTRTPLSVGNAETMNLVPVAMNCIRLATALNGSTCQAATSNDAVPSTRTARTLSGKPCSGIMTLVSGPMRIFVPSPSVRLPICPGLDAIG